VCWRAHSQYAAKQFNDFRRYEVRPHSFHHQPLGCWDCGFESHRGHGCLSFVCLSDRGLCDGPIPRPEESYRLWCVIVCDLEISRVRRHWPALGCCTTEWGHSFQMHVFLSRLYIPILCTFKVQFRCMQDRSETSGRPRKANKLAPLQTDILYNFRPTTGLKVIF
jgi:hypothetical protein